MGETVTDVSPLRLAQQDGLPGLFHIALSEQSKMRKLGDLGQAPSTIGVRAEKPGAIDAELGLAGVGARRDRVHAPSGATGGW